MREEKEGEKGTIGQVEVGRRKEKMEKMMVDDIIIYTVWCVLVFWRVLIFGAFFPKTIAVNDRIAVDVWQNSTVSSPDMSFLFPLAKINCTPDSASISSH